MGRAHPSRHQTQSARPGPYGRAIYPDTDREYYLDFGNYRAIPEWQILLRESPICQTVAEILQTRELWLFFDQIWIKEGGATKRTAWHQDATTWLTGGEQQCGFWMSIDPLEAEHSLEFASGSHRGPLYGGTLLDGSPDDDSAPVYDALPRVPDIDNHRDDFNLVSFPNTPGDAVMFHPGTIHGGGAGPGKRRTLSLRFYGDDIGYAPRLGRPSPPFPGIELTHKPGQPLRSFWFPKVYPNHE